MALPNQFKRVRLNSCPGRSSFRRVLTSTVMNSSCLLMPRAISTQHSGERIAKPAGYIVSGTVRMKMWVKWFISLEAKSTPAGSLTTIETGSTMTRRATALARTPSSRVSTLPSAIRMMRIRSESFPWSRRPDCSQAIATE